MRGCVRLSPGFRQERVEERRKLSMAPTGDNDVISGKLTHASPALTHSDLMFLPNPGCFAVANHVVGTDLRFGCLDRWPGGPEISHL